MAGIKAKGIVLRQREFGESNRMLTIFSREFGIIRAGAYGVKSIKSGKGAACQFLSFSEFELSRGKGDVYSVYGASSIESFYPVAEDIKKLSLAVYLADITYNALGEENPEERVLSLFLNTLYAVCYNGLDIKKAKWVYEIRLMSILGYMPMLTKCVKCGSMENIQGFLYKAGGVVCKKCGGEDVRLNDTVISALRYIAYAEDKKVFSFSISDEASDILEKLAERYVANHLDVEIASLAYFKSMI